MNGLNFSATTKKLAGLVSVAIAGASIGIPVAAQLNPNPSIFNEPPYNRTGATSAPMTPPMPTPMEMEMDEPSAMSSNSIVDIASSEEAFSILTAALSAADLVDVLAGEGPFTVFAPTNAAFEALPEGILEALLAPENRDVLVAILTYHVVPGEITASDLMEGDVDTVAGSPIMVMLSDGGVMVNDANVVQADIMASNGVIHVIDRIILPPDLEM